MGVYLADRRHCSNAEKIQHLTNVFQEKIINQLIWDPRVVDVYIQRVLMLTLTEPGVKNRVKSVWINQILAAQLADGSWNDFHPLFPIGRSYCFGFAGNTIDFRVLKGNFHTTAQSVLLMSLMIDKIKQQREADKREGISLIPNEAQ